MAAPAFQAALNRPGNAAPASGTAGQRLGHRLHTVLPWLLAVVLLWAPVPLGSNRPWAWTLLAVAVALVMLVWCLAETLTPSARRPGWAIWSAGTLIATALAWGLLQTVLVNGAHPVWGWLADHGIAVAPRVSLDPYAGREEVLKLTTQVGVFWLCLALARDREVARWLLNALLAIIAVCAGIGLVRYVAGWDTLFWGVEPSYRGYLTATFVNRNHAATYLNIGIILGGARILEGLAPVLGMPARAALGSGLRLLLERHRTLLLIVLGLVLASLLTGSRGGLVSLGVGLATLLSLVLLKARVGWRVVVVVLLLSGLAGYGVLRAGGEVTLARLAQLDREVDHTRDSRLLIWQLALARIAERPWQGHGLGTFEQVFTASRDPRFERVWDRAHNSYLETAVELGLPATMLWYGGLAILAGVCVRGVVVRRRSPGFAIAATSVTALVATHALVDFSLSMPAVGATYAAVLGIGCAQAVSSAAGHPRRRRPAADRHRATPRSTPATQ